MIIFHSGSGDIFSAFGRFLPVLIMFMIFLNIAGIFGKKRPPGDGVPDDYDDYDDYEDDGEDAGEEEKAKRRQQEKAIPRQTPPEPGASTESVKTQPKADDVDVLIAKMEEKLRRGKQETQDAGSLKGGRVYKDDSSAIKRGEPAAAANKAAGAAKLHREDCAVPHEKARVYKEAKAWGDEGAGLARASSRARQKEQPASGGGKLRLKRADLARGFIMGEVLGKPRSLKPYGSEEDWR